MHHIFTTACIPLHKMKPRLALNKQISIRKIENEEEEEEVESEKCNFIDPNIRRICTDVVVYIPTNC